MKRKPTASIDCLEARTHFAALLKRVAIGEVVEITRDGVPVAQLVPLNANENHEHRRAAIEEMLRFSKGRRRGKLTIKQMIELGRRY